jgi:chaperonin GroEL
VTLADSLSRKGETTVEYSDGTEIDAGWPTVHYCNVSMNTCEYANPKFLFFKDPVLDKTTLIPIMQMASERDEPLIIMAPDFDDEILLIGSQNAAQHRFKGCLLFTPGSSVPAKEDTVKDLAAQLGAKVIGLDIRPEEFKYDNHLGQAEHVLIKKQSTVIAGAKHDETDFENYCNNLRYEIETDNAGKSEYELEKLKERLAHLTGGVATIKVGDFTQIALQEKKDRYEDAICAVRAAVGDGILPGGGSPLLRISYSKVKLPANAGVAMKEFLHALSSVAKRLIDTADENAEEIIPKVIHKSKTFGFNAKTGKVADLFKEGVIDPYSVVKQAITYASATAKTFAKLDATVINEQENLSGDRLDPMQELI